VNEAPNRFAVLVNPSAGGGRAAKLLPEASHALDARGVEHRVVETTSLAHGCQEARAAAEDGEAVVVMSGDGLIGQVGGVLAETGATFGILPGGRGNDLARVLGIPTRIQGAADILAAGRTREIDVGEINGKRFLCIASCGFDSDANRLANESHFRGPLVYAWAALRALARWEAATFTLDFGEEVVQATGYTAAAANSKAYGGGMYAAPDAVLDDGLLDVGTCGDVSKLRFLRGITQIFKGEHRETMDVREWRVPEVRIEADRPFTVYADGEPITELPATVRVLPRALRIIAPAP